MIIKEFFNTLKEAVFPNSCLNCGEIINEGEFLCDFCYSELNNIRVDNQCFKCGHLKKECECKSRVFSFDGVVAPFHYEGGAKKAMFAYKLGRRMYISKFFAYKMATALKYAFYDVEFHGVCYVPVTKKVFRKRGFDQSLKLATEISELLNVPLITNQLECNKKTGQHKTRKKERFENVKGKFRSTKKCIGNILLVDDIKTTGATLEECSKQLLSSGADSVYCVTGLITRNYKKRKS